MAPRRKANSPSQEEDFSSSIEGVDERAIARLEFIALQLSKRRDRSCYMVNGGGGVNLDEQYNAAATKSILEESGADAKETKPSESLNRTVDVRSVELLTSAQYTTKKRKTRSSTSQLLETGIGHDYTALAKVCRQSYSSDLDHSIRSQSSWKIEATKRFTPFIECLPISMISLTQALAFYPKPR